MPEELPSSTQRPGETEPSPSRAELRYPPGAYYRRIALGTVLPGAGLLGTRWKVLGLAARARRRWPPASGCSFKAVAGRPAALGAQRGRAARAAAVGGRRHRGRCGAVDRLHRAHRRAVLAAPARSGRWARVLFAAAACTLVAAPSALAVRYLDVQSSVIDQVFVDDSPSERPRRRARQHGGARTRGPTCRGSTPCSSAPTPARTAGAPAPTR